MLSWPNREEWERDNRWNPLDAIPINRPVDVWAVCYRHLRNPDARWTARRVHGARWNGETWTGIPAGYEPRLWTEAMTARRYRALAA